MNTPIPLVSEILDSDVAAIAVASGRFVAIFDPKSTEGKILSLPDFGTVLIGFADKAEAMQEPNMSLFVGENDLVWFAPSEWKQSHIAKRFGMFPSTSQAMKNGFFSEIDCGFSQLQIRANKMRGILTLVKKMAAN